MFYSHVRTRASHSQPFTVMSQAEQTKALAALGEPGDELADYGDVNLTWKNHLACGELDVAHGLATRWAHPSNFPIQSSMVEKGEHTMTAFKAVPYAKERRDTVQEVYTFYSQSGKKEEKEEEEEVLT